MHINSTTSPSTSPQTSQTAEADKAMLAAIQNKFEETQKNIDTEIASFVARLFTKPVLGTDPNPMRALQKLWGQVAIWNKKAAVDPISRKIQQAIAGDATGDANWLEKTIHEIENLFEKLNKQTFSKEELDHIRQKIGRIKILVNMPLPNGELPLNYAAKLNRPEAVHLLLKLGALPFLKDKVGQTLFDYVTLNDHPTIKKVIIDHFCGSGKEMFRTILKEAAAKKNLNLQVLDFAGKYVPKQIKEMLSESAKIPVVIDDATLSQSAWVHAGLVGAVVLSWSFEKLLKANHWNSENSTLANYSEMTTQVIATLGKCMHMLETGRSLGGFINGCLKSNDQVVPTLTFIGLNALAYLYTPFAYVNSALEKFIIGASIIDTAYVFKANKKHRPWDVSLTTAVNLVNLSARCFGLFDAILIKTPMAAVNPEMMNKIARDDIEQYLIGQGFNSTEDLANVSRFLRISNKCYGAYQALLKKSIQITDNPALNKTLTAVADIFCPKKIYDVHIEIN